MADTTKIKNIIALLTAHITDNMHPPSQPGILSGRAGQLLFLWYAARWIPGLISESQFEDLLADLSPNMEVPYAMCFGHGLSGIAWFYEVILNDTEYQAEFNANSDTVLHDYVLSAQGNAEFEYVLGLNGIAAYAARRAHHGQGKQLIESLVAELIARAHFFHENECSWPTQPTSAYRLVEDKDEQEFNLGLAHGVPGILAALIALIPHLDEEDCKLKATKVLRAGCHWLVKQQQDPATYGSYYANLAGYPAKSRLGWCYGDLTIALTLFRAGALLSEPGYSKLAQAISLHASSRGPTDAMIQDAGLCHGAAGLIVIFSLLQRYYPHPEIAAASAHWRDFVLSRFEKQGLAGFNKLKDGPDNLHFEEDYSFLSGYAGVGLCLLVAAGQEPDWIDALLLA
ncbi:lanthionine synthetase LanC family protein [Alkalimonas mucilaginosa]|uniref:Lanthionine synthetase LanC family protein n=1 Tax=Alkalimonas mucilaginosa TaxID=3057676 RepID=A0ABU7JIM4_9GAMM|nr:lanthionine synthetase LanC family protein [Alkalimonas sp. MEB004]MEE2025515.1 lanthionine synthetase LanC family protein [Alkalimonas sp. MEB004]